MDFLFLLIFLAPIALGFIFLGVQKKVQVTHSDSGLQKNGFHGYCWTYFIFGWFVPLFRGELGVGALHFLFTVITLGVFWLVMPFLYNKQYTSRLLTSGFSFSDSEENNELARKKLKVSDLTTE
ncbi:MAG: hypothetical protein CML59_02120 [Rhodobacteraceae bacterium]|nr:hypothetical protein [Paracoccaceae bacterium]